MLEVTDIWDWNSRWCEFGEKDPTCAPQSLGAVTAEAVAKTWPAPLEGGGMYWRFILQGYRRPAPLLAPPSARI